MNREMPVECAVCMHRCRLLEGQLGRCRARKNEGGRNVLVTNGSAALWVLVELLPCIDAMNIDLKGFTEDDYRKLGGDLETVKDFIKRAAQGCHVELTTLIVPGENDSRLRWSRRPAGFPPSARRSLCMLPAFSPDIAWRLRMPRRWGLCTG